MKVLIIIGSYLPGRKAGGPVVTVENMVEVYGDRYDFRVLTKDRDIGEKHRYNSIEDSSTNRMGKAYVKYVSPWDLNIRTIYRYSKGVDVIYICGVFNFYTLYTLLLKRIKEINMKIVVAPMGSLSYGAYNIKKGRKKVWITLCKIMGLFKDVHWAVTSEVERKELESILNIDEKNIYITPDIPQKIELQNIEREKEKGKINIIWLSRICVKKNLLGTIDTISNLSGSIHFDIYGPVEDVKYWELCRVQLEKLPNNVSWKKHEMAERDKVIEAFSNAHVFLFETFSENYGHVIYEALASGCPCVISNMTPWSDLEENGIGYCFELSDRSAFCIAMQKYIEMEKHQFGVISAHCREYAIKHYRSRIASKGYAKLFEE